MPISGYFGGHGEKVAKGMQRHYGKRWKQVFYATANARDQNPEDSRKKARRDALKRRAATR